MVPLRSAAAPCAPRRGWRGYRRSAARRRLRRTRAGGFANRNCAPSASWLRSCARAFSSGMARTSSSFCAGVQAKLRRDEIGERRVVRLADVMAVEVLELLEVEARRRLADMGEVEPFDRLFAADDLVVAMAPAEAKQIIGDRLGKEAELVAIGIDAQRAMALAKAWRRRGRGSAGRGHRSAPASPSRG